MKKNIVIITLGYYPDMSAVTAVLDKYIQVLKGAYHFHIIALPTRYKVDRFVDPDIDIYYMNDYWRSLHLKNLDQYKDHPTIVNKMMCYVLKVRGFLMGIKEPYSSLRWMKRAAYDLLGQISKMTNVDAIISVSGLFLYLHEAACDYKKTNPQVRWITFVTDPISFSSLGYMRFRFNKKRRFLSSYKKEKRIYDSADYNIFAENLFFDAIEKFHQPRNKTFQFRFVLEDIQSKFVSVSVGRKETITLIYAGALYRVIRNPEYMLSIISKVPNLYLDMYVQSFECMDILKKYESDRIVIHDSVDVKRYKEMICNEYDILINIGNNCENQLPSKTLELLSSGRPILNFYCYKDSQYDMIERYPLGLNVGREDKDAVKKVESFCREMKGKKLKFADVVKLYPENSLERQKQILIDLIES